MRRRMIGVALNASALALITALLISSSAHAHATAPAWFPSTASWYSPTGNATSCGNRMDLGSWHVAALAKREYRCGRAIRICSTRSRCANVQVRDRGAWRSDGRTWDLSPRVRAALHCSDLCNVKWREGWGK